MARQPYFANGTDKQIEIYGTFAGGMNTQEHPSKLSDAEFVLMENVDIVSSGAIMNRGAYSRTNDPASAITGISQGVFYYEDNNGGKIIEAIGGKLYHVSGNTYTLLSILNLAGGFQTTRQIEAVQVRSLMYFATGSGLVSYNGIAASLVSAYQPTGLEALYIGKNGLAADPDNYLADITAGAANLVLGIKTDQRYGIINKAVNFTAYVEKIASDTLEYKFSSKMVTETKFTDWGAWSTSKTKAHTFGKNTDYMIKCEIRKTGTTVVLSEYVIPKFRVASTADKNPEPTINFDDMKTCNRILLHYDRLVLYGDTNNPDHMYTSHLNILSYFPRTNILRIIDPLRGGLRSVVQYKNFLVAFTDNSIVMITGVAPAEYAKVPVHTTLGTKHPYSVKVIKNYIVFVGRDSAVYLLKSFSYSTTDKLNVERIDLDVRESLSAVIKGITKPILTAVHNDQYYLYLNSGSNCYIYRFYYELGVWVRDYVTNNFSTMNDINGILHLSTDTNGRLYKLIRTSFNDDVSTDYTMKIITKDYDFNMPHHKKKLKQFQIIAKLLSNTYITCVIDCDNVQVSSETVRGSAGKNFTDSQKFNLTTSGRFRYVRTTITVPVVADIQLLTFGYIFKMSSPR